MTRAQIAACANEEARISSRRGAPHLEESSPLPTLVDWLAWNDPNGEWLRLSPEFVTQDAWDTIQEMLQ